MDFINLVKLECCTIDFKAKNKDDALKKIANTMKKCDALAKTEANEIFRNLKNREETGSTGFSSGIAIPHCQISGIKEFVIGVLISNKGIDFESLDKKKSKVFVVILGPEGAGTEHLQLLAKISNVLKSSFNRKSLLSATTNIDLYENFIRFTEGKEVEFNKQGKDKLMLLIMQNEDLMQDITEIFVQYNITQATLIESKKMENLISEIPLFMGFFNFSSKKSVFNEIILAIIKEDKIKAVINSIEDITGDLNHYKGLSLLVLDLLHYKGIF